MEPVPAEPEIITLRRDNRADRVRMPNRQKGYALTVGGKHISRQPRGLVPRADVTTDRIPDHGTRRGGRKLPGSIADLRAKISTERTADGVAKVRRTAMVARPQRPARRIVWLPIGDIGVGCYGIPIAVIVTRPIVRPLVTIGDDVMSAVMVTMPVMAMRVVVCVVPVSMVAPAVGDRWTGRHHQEDTEAGRG